MLTNVKKELDKFRNAVVAEAKKELVKQGKKSSGDLYNSIDSDLEVYKSNNFALSFTLGDYGEFVDKGVRGIKSGRWKTDFQFRKGVPSKKMIISLEHWIKSKGLRGRNKKGRFISNKSLSFLIARSIFRKGLKPSLFFTKPFNKHFKKVSKELVDSFGLDIDNFLQYTLNKYE